MNPQGFTQLVEQLLSADNEPRKIAEELFDKLKQHPDACAGNLLAVMRTAPNVEHRSFAAIMLRKVRFNGPMYVHSSGLWQLNMREFSKCKLLDLLCNSNLTMSQVLTRDDPTLWSKCSPAMQVGRHPTLCH